MNITIVGPGAMGCFFAGTLARGGHDVILLDYQPARAARIRRQGLTLEGPDGVINVPVRATASLRGLGHPDLVLICVKTYQTILAAERIKHVVGKDSAVFSIQNGLGNVEALSEVFGPERVLGGVTTQAVMLTGPGQVRFATFGKTHFGWAKRDHGRAERLAEISLAFKEAGLEAEAVERIERWVWHKVILNAAINPLGALLKLRNGDFFALPALRELMTDIVREAVAVARLSGILLPSEDYMAELEKLIGNTRDHACSMLQDVLRGKRTEIESINGALGKIADDMGMVTTVNSLMAALVLALEQTYAQRVDRL